MIVRQEARDAEFLQSYRRIFSNLNRHAKPADMDTDANIVMDEDDAIAILTRRLLTEHDFLIWKGSPGTSPRLKAKGKNLRAGDPYFTTLRTLYNMNEKLLSTTERAHRRFASRENRQFRPQEEELDAMFDELGLYWNAILEEIVVLKADPVRMREHDAKIDDPDGLTDNRLFWPVGQELFADVTRILLNRRLPDPDSPNVADVRSCVRIFSKVNWDLRTPPWEGLLLIREPDGRGRMRNEDRKLSLEVAKRILLVRVGLDDPQPELKEDWRKLLIPRLTNDEVDAVWEEVAKPLGE